jgi:hypothetical protein
VADPKAETAAVLSSAGTINECQKKLARSTMIPLTENSSETSPKASVVKVGGFCRAAPDSALSLPASIVSPDDHRFNDRLGNRGPTSEMVEEAAYAPPHRPVDVRRCRQFKIPLPTT